MIHSPRALRFLVVLGLLLAAGPAHAARLLKAIFEQDGNVVLQTYYDDRGTEDAATVWRYLGQQPIMVAKEKTTIQPDEKDPRTATLTGEVHIRIQHVHRILGQAQVTGLKLIRRDVTKQLWFLPQEEVTRTAREAGLAGRD